MSEEVTNDGEGNHTALFFCGTSESYDDHNSTPKYRRIYDLEEPSEVFGYATCGKGIEPILSEDRSSYLCP